MSTDTIIQILVIPLILWTYQRIRENKRRYITVKLLNGEYKTFFYTEGQLSRERDEKSVLSSEGLSVRRPNNDELPWQVRWVEMEKTKK